MTEAVYKVEIWYSDHFLHEIWYSDHFLREIWYSDHSLHEIWYSDHSLHEICQTTLCMKFSMVMFNIEKFRNIVTLMTSQGAQRLEFPPKGSNINNFKKTERNMEIWYSN